MLIPERRFIQSFSSHGLPWPLKRQVKFVADYILFFFLSFFQRKQVLAFLVNKISRLIFSKIIKKNIAVRLAL